MRYGADARRVVEVCEARALSKTAQRGREFDDEDGYESEDDGMEGEDDWTPEMERFLRAVISLDTHAA